MSRVLALHFVVVSQCLFCPKGSFDSIYTFLDTEIIPHRPINDVHI